MRRSSMGLASAVAPSAVKQGGGVTNQLSSMLQSLQEQDPRWLNNTFTSTDSGWQEEAGPGEQTEGEVARAACILPARDLRLLQVGGEWDVWRSASGPPLPSAMWVYGNNGAYFGTWKVWLKPCKRGMVTQWEHIPVKSNSMKCGEMRGGTETTEKKT